MMLKHGHRGGISVEATLGTNDKKVLFMNYYVYFLYSALFHMHLIQVSL